MIDDSNRESVAYSSRDTNVAADYTITDITMKMTGKPLSFNNTYSDLTPKWNL
jgi:hypothetical protein